MTTQPFRSIDGMRRAQLDAWRHTVGENDTIIYLGDVTVGPPAGAVDEALAALPGLTLLVRRSTTTPRVRGLSHREVIPVDFKSTLCHDRAVAVGDPTERPAL